MISLIQHLSYKSVIARPYNTEHTRQAELADQEGGKKKRVTNKTAELQKK